MSGLLCGFSVGGDCPPPDVLVGSFFLSDLPQTTVVPGAPLPGSTLTLTDDNIAGLVTLNYTLAAPLNTGVTGDQNFFKFTFAAHTPFSASSTLVQAFNVPGTYDFVQQSPHCSSINNGVTQTCGSDTPVYGFDITNGVPEPATPALTILGGNDSVLARLAEAMRFSSAPISPLEKAIAAKRRAPLSFEIFESGVIVLPSNELVTASPDMGILPSDRRRIFCHNTTLWNRPVRAH